MIDTLNNRKYKDNAPANSSPSLTHCGVYSIPICQSQVDRVIGQWTKYGTLYVPMHSLPTYST